MFNAGNTTEELDSFIKRLGNPISTILLHSSCSFFRIPEIDGAIGYQLVGHCAVVMGDPICLPIYRAKLAQAFYSHCQKCKWKIVYFLVTGSFADWALHEGCRTLIEVADELTLDPTHFQKRQKLRWKINQSIQQGVVVQEYKHIDLSLEKEMKKAIETWLETKQGRQIHLGDLQCFFTGKDKRIFYAAQQDKIVGLLKLLPIDCFQGWALSFFFALADASVGTTEHLMGAVFETLAHEQCSFLCLGAVSKSSLGEMVGLNIFSRFFAHLIFKISKQFFNLDARRVYLNKYHPSASPLYLVFSEELTGAELMALKHILHVK